MRKRRDNIWRIPTYYNLENARSLENGSYKTIQQHTTVGILTSRSKEPPPGIIPYNEIVEEALCFGWIDSSVKRLDNGRLAQRLSKRRKGSSWSRINKERYITLEKQGLITEAGQKEWEKSLHIESH